MSAPNRTPSKTLNGGGGGGGGSSRRSNKDGDNNDGSINGSSSHHIRVEEITELRQKAIEREKKTANADRVVAREPRAGETPRNRAPDRPGDQAPADGSADASPYWRNRACRVRRLIPSARAARVRFWPK